LAPSTECGRRTAENPSTGFFSQFCFFRLHMSRFVSFSRLLCFFFWYVGRNVRLLPGKMPSSSKKTAQTRMDVNWEPMIAGCFLRPGELWIPRASLFFLPALRTTFGKDGLLGAQQDPSGGEKVAGRTYLMALLGREWRPLFVARTKQAEAVSNKRTTKIAVGTGSSSPDFESTGQTA